MYRIKSADRRWNIWFNSTTHSVLIQQDLCGTCKHSQVVNHVAHAQTVSDGSPVICERMGDVQPTHQRFHVGLRQHENVTWR